MQWNAINAALAAIGAILFFHAINVDALYRLGSHVVAAGVLWAIFKHVAPLDAAGRREIAKKLFAIFLYPAALIVIALMAGADPFSKSVRHVLLYACIPASLLLACRISALGEEDLSRAARFAAVLIVVYAAVEVLATFALSRPFGTLTNPHYLAQYCMLCLIAALYLVSQTRLSVPRKLLFASMAGLGTLLIHSSSRPAWIALVVTGVITAGFMRRKIGLRTPIVLALVIATVYALNLGNARVRVDDLILNLAHEERVTIWRDAGRMQLASSPRQWLVGHGIKSFYEDFKAYSERGAMYGRDFKTPHNYFIELLYTLGVAGLAASMMLIFVIYFWLYRLYKRSRASPYVAALIATLTANLLFTAITVDFFSSYNLIIIAVVSGLSIVYEKLLPPDNPDHPEL